MNHYRINEIKLKIGEPKEHLQRKIERKLSLPKGTIRKTEIRRESIDARDKTEIRLVYTVDFYTDRPVRSWNRSLKEVGEEGSPKPVPGRGKLIGRPVIVGFGPCGIFAALELAKAGYRPLVIERGAPMNERVKDVDRFRKDGTLDPESNVLFGEGGAGTFSDGKLTSGIKSGHIREVLEVFAEAGAGDDILYLHRPHIGTDVLRSVIVNIRHQIEALGGEIRFHSKLEQLNIDNGQLRSVRVATSDPEAGKSDAVIETNALILAIGHSARDTFEMVHETGLPMQQKPLSIGVRMEHPQELIDRAQYGDEKRLPPADYKVSYHASNGRGVYSFCMCPGGEVIVCSTKEGELCVNGMSNRKRDSGTANSGILCDVRTSDFESDDVLAGVRFQERYEKIAFDLGKKQNGRIFAPPWCTMAEFLNPEPDNPVCRSLPDFASEAIREAVPHFARKIKGYDDPEAIIRAVETRSSSPVRIVRDDSGESEVRGIYPAGEGAGYAGGITSAACDGIRAAAHIIERFAAPEQWRNK